MFLEYNSAVITERDYAEALKAKFDMQIKSEAFGSNHTPSIEGSICEYQNKYLNYVSNEGNVKINFHSNFSDDSAHNAAATFEHMKKFIH